MAVKPARTHSGRRTGKMNHPATKPKVAPVKTGFIHPGAIAKARALLASKTASGHEVHMEYDADNECMWIRNGVM